MTDRIVEIAESPAHVSVRLGALEIKPSQGELLRVPLEDLAVLVLTHPAITITQQALGEVAQHGAVVINCDRKAAPVSMSLPLAGNAIQTERMAAQANASKPLRKRLWQEIVREKIRAQARCLGRLGRTGADGLEALAPRVQSGDPDNLEAQAAQRYWKLVFGDPGFRRDREKPDQNRLLNYGYAILRACTSRAICASGLHPSLGIHHHNRYDTFCLASDLMEPFRPVVDERVAHITDELGANVGLDREVKHGLISGILGRHEADGEARTLFDLVGRASSSLAGVYAGSRRKLFLRAP